VGKGKGKGDGEVEHDDEWESKMTRGEAERVGVGEVRR
jgi:hypothetical protein